MSSFNQGVPTVPTLINSSNCIVLGNTSSGTALTVQQLGAGAVMNVATSTGSSALFVSSTGQVGIGQTNPQTLLHVTATAANSAIFIDNSITGGATPYNTVRPSASGAGSANCHIWSDGNAVGTSDAGFLRIAAGGGSSGITKSYIDISGYSTVADMNQNIVFGTSGSEKMRITTGGNLGIGTTNPAYTLDIGQFGSSTYTLRLAAASTTAGTMGTSIRMMEANDTYGFSFQNLSASRLGIFRHSASSTGSEILTIMRDNPYVGIGTAGPGYLLQVNSAATGSETVAAFLKPSMATGGTFAGIQVGGAIAIGGAGAMGFLNYGTNASNVFQLSLNGVGGSAININSTGVGIGTTNPGPMLDIWATGTTFQTSGSLRFYRSDAGSFWKFTGPDTGNSLYLLNAGGVGVSITNGSTSWAAASDSRLKNIIAPISNALSKVDLLNPVMYSWKNDETNEPHPGLIAQDVLKVQPEAVSSDKDGMYGVRYTELVPLAFAAIKEISAKNAALEARLAALEQSLATATANNSSLESKLAA